MQVPEGVYPFEAGGVATRFPACGNFRRTDHVAPVKTMRFCHGHTPLPLFSQINAYFWLHIKMAYVLRESSEIAIDYPYRDSANPSMSMSGVYPETISATSFPEPAAIAQPVEPWPILM